MASDTRPKLNHQGQPREKVVLQAGFHLSDWLRIMKTPGTDFSGRNGGPPKKITKQELATHNTKYDCWTSYQGKVYNITNYVPYHPGGEPKIMLGAGRDCTTLFNKYHAWVNIESMLSKCYVGTLSNEEDTIAEAKEEDDISSSITQSTVRATAIPLSDDVDDITARIEAQKLLDTQEETDS